MQTYKKFLPQFYPIAVLTTFTAVVSNGFFFAAILAALIVWGIASMFLSDDYRTWKESDGEQPAEWFPGNPQDRWRNGYTACVGATVMAMIMGCLLNLYQLMIIAEEGTPPTTLGYLIMIPFVFGMMSILGGGLAICSVKFYHWVASRNHNKQYLADL